ncbi:MAG: heme exporter protein CcmB [Betaproteobacteria bacterium]|nr:heme exporter protein CcmB [Betaproteobacteria bacterium]
MIEAAPKASPDLIGAYCCIVQRDLRLALRRRVDALNTLVFFVIVVSLFPLSVGAEPALFRAIAPGVIWVAALLASMLALQRLFASDYADGTLEQLLLAPQPLGVMVAAKVTAHWLVAGLPLVIAAPLLGLQFNLPADSLGVLVLSLMLGTPTLGLIGAIGAALTLGLRSAGVLVSLLVLPLYIPVLIFGAGAVEAAASGLGAGPHLSLLGAFLAAALFFAPWATSFALRISME